MTDQEEAAARRALNHVGWMLMDAEWGKPLPWAQRWRVLVLAIIWPQRITQMAYAAAADMIATIDPAQFTTRRQRDD